ncbi:MAG: endonuclease domain-containing protein [Actinobacteria bacterium]|nr:endonuclease domain-containing protein [Actinomycetota bacterium]
MRIDDLLASSRVLSLRQHPRSARSIQRAAEAGRVVSILPGVFVVPEDVLNPAVRLLAVSAWSAAGAICGRTAAQVYSGNPVTMPIALRSPNRARPVAWLRVSRGRIPAEHQVHHRGLVLVSPAYACLEIAAADHGEAAFRFLRTRITTVPELEATLPAFEHTPGNPARRRVALQAIANPWSYAEALLHDLLRSAGITGWVANEPLWLGGALLYPDVWFREAGVILEFDGKESHTGGGRFEDDRYRQNLLVREGFRVLRITWTMLVERPAMVLDTILAVLELPRSGLPPGRMGRV